MRFDDLGLLDQSLDAVALFRSRPVSIRHCANFHCLTGRKKRARGTNGAVDPEDAQPHRTSVPEPVYDSRRDPGRLSWCKRYLAIDCFEGRSPLKDNYRFIAVVPVEGQLRSCVEFGEAREKRTCSELSRNEIPCSYSTSAIGPLGFALVKDKILAHRALVREIVTKVT